MTITWSEFLHNLKQSSIGYSTWSAYCGRKSKLQKPMPDNFEDYASLYLQSASLAYSTRLSYATSLEIYWTPHLGKRKIKDVRYSELLLIDQRNNWPSPKTRKNALVPLRGVFAVAYLDQQLPEQSSPAHQIKLGKHQKSRPDPFSKEERDRIMDWMRNKPQGLYFRTAFATGMRSGELIALEWSQFDGESLRVHRSRVRGRNKGTKTATERNVYLPAWLCQELEHRCKQSTNGAIFLNQYKRPYQKPDKLNQVFRKCLKALDIRARTGPYPWRHTYASVGITEGAEPAFLARQLGHSLDTFYRTYAQWISQDRDRIQRQIMDRSWRE